MNISEVLDILVKVEQQGIAILDELHNEETDIHIISAQMAGTVQIIENLKTIIPAQIYAAYDEFFCAFKKFCVQCRDIEFLAKNMETMESSLELFVECMTELINTYRSRVKKCVCCNQEVIYSPIPDYYASMRKQLGILSAGKSETINKEEYMCPDCGASDRDRMIIAFLKKENLQKAAEGTKVLQFAPASSIDGWIRVNCPHLNYETTDLFMKGVTFQSDIQDMQMVQDETYDLIICSHVLEHVQDDRKALAEMKRILKPDGKIVFLVPVDLDADSIDEEWGLSEAENWKRFGQGDHCRKYSKKGLLERLEEQFFVHCLGKKYFGQEVFEQCGLIDTSTLYVLTKQEEVSLNFEEEIIVDEKLCQDGPLVSVIMSCYNHGNFVAEAIESVIHQSYKNIEFLVADDGSKDDSVEKMKKYSKHFTKEYYFEDNVGGRFQLLKEEARGKYIALINSDDVWEQDKLAMQVKYLEEHEECGVCFTWTIYTNENLEPIENNIFIQKNRSQYEWMKFFWEKGNALCNPSSVMRREFSLQTPRYGSGCWQLPDFFKWIDLIQITSIYVLPRVTTKMRRYQNGEKANASATTPKNILRHSVEEGCNWLWVIRDMDNTYFKNAFYECMLDKEATTEQEIKCEKYFLLLKHKNVFVQSSALQYIAEVYNEIEETLEIKYHYTIKNLKEDMVKVGVTKFFVEEQG